MDLIAESNENTRKEKVKDGLLLSVEIAVQLPLFYRSQTCSKDVS